MKKVNFKEFGIYSDITRASKKNLDVRKDFADVLYTRISGIEAHDLAFRIYRSEGDIELSDSECALLLNVAKSCSGAFYDSLKDLIDSGDSQAE